MSRYRWVVLFASFYAFVTFAFALQLVPPLMGSIIYEFNITHTQAGLLMSMVVIPGIFLSIPAGMLTDRYGVKLTGFTSTILVALGCFITALANSFNTALLGRFILGVGGAFLATAMPSIIPQWFPPEELGKAMGIYGINMPFASVIAFPIASILKVTYGWRYPFYIGTLIATLNVILFFFLVREGPLKRESILKSSVSKALKSVEAWKVGIVWLFFNASAISFTTWSPNIFENFKAISPVYASFLASILMWAALPCVPFFGWISDKIRKRRLLIIIGSLLMSGNLVAVAYASNMALIASIIVLGISAALIPPVIMVMPSEILGPILTGTGFGIVAICLNTGIAVASPLIGLLLDMTGSSDLSFLGMALFSVLGAIVACTLKTK